MSFYYSPDIGTYHLNEAKPPRVVPQHEKHKWAGKPAWGESTTCVRCGCVKRRLKTLPDYTETYQMPGGEVLSERPACTGMRNPVF